MSYPIDLLQAAAGHARDVATLIDAARVLTFTAQAKSRQRAVQPDACSVAQVSALFHTAGSAALHARQMAAETQLMLGPLAEASQAALREPASEDEALLRELEDMRVVLSHSIKEALRALDMLETVQELGQRSLEGAAPCDTYAMEQSARYVEELFERLRASGPRTR